MKTLSIQRPRPSMLIRTSAARSTLVKAMPVNWVDSTGRRNTVFIQPGEELVENAWAYKYAPRIGRENRYVLESLPKPIVDITIRTTEGASIIQ